MSYHRDTDQSLPTYNVFRNKHKGWTLYTLCRELGMEMKAVKRQLDKRGLKLDAPKGHTLSERDVETVTGVIKARRAERLYGQSRRVG